MVRVTWEAPAIMVITLDRPERRNAVDLASLLAIRTALDAAREPDRRARVVVLTGAPPAFCAGADLDGVDNIEFTTTLLGVLTGFTELAIPVIGAIDGAALGAGTQLAAACDLRVATSRSRFGIPGRPARPRRRSVDGQPDESAVHGPDHPGHAARCRDL